MERLRVIHPSDVLPAVSGTKGLLFDVREGEHDRLHDSGHLHVPLSDIEKFMTGELSVERMSRLVSILLFLASKWRSAYILADSFGEADAAARHLAKLGFKDVMLVTESARSLFSGTRSGRVRASDALRSNGACLCI